MFIRPDIMKVLKLKRQKNNKRLMVVLFTNNQGPESWAQLIVKYFDHKLRYKLFDTVIPAYKVDGKQVAKCRTSHEKKQRSFRLSRASQRNALCFIDDQQHNQMMKDDVDYILIKPMNHRFHSINC